MSRHLIAWIIALLGVGTLAKADDAYTLGNVAFTVPTGWTQADSNETRQTYASPDGRQQLTISILRLDKAPSFEEFKLLCSHRYDSERDGVKDLVLIPKDPAPRNDDGQFIMTFSGEENPRSRVFSGLLWIKGNQLVTVYVEGIGITTDHNSDSFHAIIKSLH